MSRLQPEASSRSKKGIPVRLRRVLHELGERISGLDKVTASMLFGSYSKGTYGKNSDVDVAVFVSADNAEDLIGVYRRAQRFA